MQQIFYRSLREYIETQGIEIVECVDFYKKNIGEVNEKDVERQLKLISSFHNKMKRCDEYVLERIDNQTGKILEIFKMELNSAKQIVKDIENNTPKSNFENIIIKKGNEIIDFGEKCIENIYSNGYIDTIVRSMDEVEFCLGDTFFDNLNEKDGILQIKNIKKISYNTVEMDAFNLLSKLKRKGLNMNWKNFIESFCYFENLNWRSEEIVRWLMNYPYDFVKCCNRYKKKNKKWSDEKYQRKLMLAIDQAEKVL